MSSISLLNPPLEEHAKMETYHPFMNVVVVFVTLYFVGDIFLCFLLVFLFCVLRGVLQRLGVASLDRRLHLVPTNNPPQIVTVLSDVEVAGSPLFGCWC